MSEYADEHQLDVDTFEIARSIHRVVRAMHDGECPKCHNLFQSTAMQTVAHRANGTRGDEMCPHCLFTITVAEQDAAIDLFGPVMDRNLEMFEKWRKSMKEQTPVTTKLPTAGDGPCRECGAFETHKLSCKIAQYQPSPVLDFERQSARTVQVKGAIANEMRSVSISALDKRQSAPAGQPSSCCYIAPTSGFQCGNNAEWRICWGNFTPDEYTESCTRHVGEMLTDATEHRIYSLDGLSTLMP